MWSKTLIAVTCFVTARSFHKSSHLGAVQLRYLAHLSSLQAENLARHQVVAANLVIFNTQNNLAEMARQTAAAARIVAKTKGVAVKILEERLKEEEKFLETEMNHYYLLKQVASNFTRVAEESKNLAGVLQGVLEEVQKVSLHEEVNREVLSGERNQTEDVSFGVGFH